MLAKHDDIITTTSRLLHKRSGHFRNPKIVYNLKFCRVHFKLWGIYASTF